MARSATFAPAAPDDVLALRWSDIRRVVAQAQASSMHVAIACCAGPDGTPSVSPMGTLFLRSDCSGFYFDRYPGLLSDSVDRDSRVCVMAVNTGKLFWLRSLWRGRFGSVPGVRLYGTAGPLRPASRDELQAVEERVRSARWLKGGRLLWSSFSHVRDLRFTSFRPVVYPVMMEGLWSAADAGPTRSKSGHGR